MSIPVSRFHPAAHPLLGVHTFVLYVCVSVSALLKGHLYRFSRSHMYMLICDLCVSLSDLLHSV